MHTANDNAMAHGTAAPATRASPDPLHRHVGQRADQGTVMDMTTLRIRPASADQADTLGHLIAAAFAPMDISRWLVTDLRTRLRVQGAQFTLFVRHALQYGVVDTVDAEVAVAVWLPSMPDQPIPPIPHYTEQLAAICGRHLDRFASLDHAMDAHHPRQAHWHLAFLAVHPAWQSQGLGSALLRHRHRSLDAIDMPAYLQAGDHRARRLYLRHGYILRPEGPFSLPDGGPPMWPMWRDSQPGGRPT